MCCVVKGILVGECGVEGKRWAALASFVALLFHFAAFFRWFEMG